MLTNLRFTQLCNTNYEKTYGFRASFMRQFDSV
nr:MAG TPA: hypothetical protein [Crassvirales sp.]